MFRVEYTLDQSAGREFGSVFLNERDNVAVAVVAAGYAKVRPAGGQQSAFYEDLARAQEQAEAKALGLWTKVCLRWVAGLVIPDRAGTCGDPCTVCLADDATLGLLNRICAGAAPPWWPLKVFTTIFTIPQDAAALEAAVRDVTSSDGEWVYERRQRAACECRPLGLRLQWVTMLMSCQSQQSSLAFPEPYTQSLPSSTHTHTHHSSPSLQPLTQRPSWRPPARASPCRPWWRP